MEHLDPVAALLTSKYEFRPPVRQESPAATPHEAMAAAADSGEGSLPSPPRNPVEEFPTGVLEGLPWVDYAVEQVQLVKGTVDEAVGSAVQVARSRWSEIRSTSSAHLQQTLFALQEALGDVGALYTDYEGAAFGKLKEGILIAASHPTVSCGVTAGVGIFASRRARRYLVQNTLHFLVRKESLLSSAESKAKVLRQSVDVMKLEKQKLEERASMAKTQMDWGKTELRKASNQIRGILHSVYNIERQATGLKIILREFSGKEASPFRTKVSTFPSQVKQEKKALDKVISRIRNCGILT